MKHIINMVMVVVMTATSSLAGVHDNTWAHDFPTWQGETGDVWADKENDGEWQEIDPQTGAYIRDYEISDVDMVEWMDGRFVKVGDYYKDSTIYTGDQARDAIVRAEAALAQYKIDHAWDYFWGTTLNPQNTGWDDFWNTCADPASHSGNPIGACAGTVFAGIGAVIAGVYVAIGATIMGTIMVASVIPVTTTVHGLTLSQWLLTLEASIS